MRIWVEVKDSGRDEAHIEEFGGETKTALAYGNSSYNSWSYIVPNDCKIFAGSDEKSIYGYFSISVVPAGASSGIRYRFYSTEDTLPTIDEPLEVTAGSTVFLTGATHLEIM